jgi:RNA polymerase sigma-70 factor (ECF subfamily)
VSDLLEAWVPRVYRFALRLSGDPHAAEDLTQETFLRAWRRRGQLRDPAAVRVWLFRITANLWRDQLRRGRYPVAQAGPLQDVASDSTQPPERLAAVQDELRQALEAMAELPPRQREVLYLSACEGMTSAEVAEVLGLSPAAVKASLSLARQKMRERLPYLHEPTPTERRP